MNEINNPHLTSKCTAPLTRSTLAGPNQINQRNSAYLTSKCTAPLARSTLAGPNWEPTTAASRPSSAASTAPASAPSLRRNKDMEARSTGKGGCHATRTSGLNPCSAQSAYTAPSLRREKLIRRGRHTTELMQSSARSAFKARSPHNKLCVTTSGDSSWDSFKTLPCTHACHALSGGAWAEVRFTPIPTTDELAEWSDRQRSAVQLHSTQSPTARKRGLRSKATTNWNRATAIWNGALGLRPWTHWFDLVSWPPVGKMKQGLRSEATALWNGALDVKSWTEGSCGYGGLAPKALASPEAQACALVIGVGI